MSRLKWDQTGEKLYETGVSNGVLFPMTAGTYGEGIAWNGLSSVTESPSGNEETAIYADNIKYLSLRSAPTFGFTVEYYTCPPEFEQCNGMEEVTDGVTFGQQKLRSFGMCYRTKVGNDTELDDYGYKLHLIYNAMVTPSQHAYSTINDSPSVDPLSNEATTTPVPVNHLGSDGKALKPTSQIIIDSTRTSADLMKKIEDILYGTDGDDAKEPRLPLPDEILTLMADG